MVFVPHAYDTLVCDGDVLPMTCNEESCMISGLSAHKHATLYPFMSEAGMPFFCMGALSPRHSE